MLDEMQEEEEEEDECNAKRWTKKIMLDEMQEEEEEDKCRLRKKEEEAYDRTKVSKLGRSVFEPTSNICQNYDEKTLESMRDANRVRKIST